MDLIRSQSFSGDAQDLVNKVDGLLTDYEIYHRNLRRLHWDQSLRPFLDFSDKLEKLYHVADDSKHALAEQLMSLGGAPDLQNIDVAHLLPQTRLNALREVRGFDDAIRSILQNSSSLLEEVKEVFMLATELNEGATQQLMTGLMNQLGFTMAVFNGVRLAHLN